MPSDSPGPWFPLFEFADFTYWTFLVLPEAEELMGLSGGPVTAKSSSIGSISFGQAFKEAGDRYRVSGWIDTSGRPRIEVNATGALRSGGTPATFEATCEEVDGENRRPVCELVGWVFPQEPIQYGAARVLNVRGSVRMLSGTDTATPAGVGGVRRGDVGLFEIIKQQ
jgi:hypothetical protein